MTVKIDKAFLTAFQAGAFGLPIANENADYTPTAGTAHVELKTMLNDELPVGLNSVNDVTGLFQFKLKYKAGSGAIAAKTMHDTIQASFPVGLKLSYDGQEVFVTGKQRGLNYTDGGWFVVLGRVNFTAFLQR